MTARFTGVLDEAFQSIVSRPGRMVLTCLGSVLGIGSMVASVGLSSSASAEIMNHFNTGATTLVTFEASQLPTTDTTAPAPSMIDMDSEKEVTFLNGVVSSGVRSDFGSHEIEYPARTGALTRSGSQASVVGMSSSLQDLLGIDVYSGRWFDAGHIDRHESVAVIGSALAERLGITFVNGQQAIEIDHQRYLVIGLSDFDANEAGLSSSIIIPISTGLARFESDSALKLCVEVKPGAANLIARQIPVMLSPEAPGKITAIYTPDPENLRSAVDAEAGTLVYFVSLSGLVVGTLSILCAGLIAVNERRTEIGLRRAVGARKSEIALQIILESSWTGTIGGIMGVTLAMFVLGAICIWNGWPPVLPSATAPTGVAIGAISGTLGGAVPAWRSARIQPALALTSN